MIEIIAGLLAGTILGVSIKNQAEKKKDHTFQRSKNDKKGMVDLSDKKTLKSNNDKLNDSIDRVYTDASLKLSKQRSQLNMESIESSESDVLKQQSMSDSEQDLLESSKEFIKSESLSESEIPLSLSSQDDQHNIQSALSEEASTSEQVDSITFVEGSLEESQEEASSSELSLSLQQASESENNSLEMHSESLLVDEEDKTSKELMNDMQSQAISVDDIDVSYHEMDLEDANVETICKQLGEKLDQNKLIGYDLLQILGNASVRENLYRYTRNSLIMNYPRTGNYIGDKRKIIITLIIIAFDYYDGSYWDHVEQVFESVYRHRSREKLNGILRSMISYYAHNEKRQINFVIRQTITPKAYLGDFIEFMFDIYKNDFKYSLMQDHLIEYLRSIFYELSNVASDETNVVTLSNKKYTLIKTTKSIVDNPEWFGELIMYSKMILQYIDQVYWTNNFDGLPYREFFEPVFTDWIEKNNALFFKGRTTGTRKKSKWNTSIILDGKNITLKIPNHMLKDGINVHNVRIVIRNGDRIIKEIRNPFIEKIMFGYLMQERSVMINDPLGKLAYDILDGNKLLYSSNQSLYRDYLIFDDTNKEIKSNRNYEGDIEICAHDGDCEEDCCYYKEKHYALYVFNVKKYDLLKVANQTISFSKIEDIAVDGEEIEHLKIKVGHSYYSVYRKIDQMRFLIPDDHRVSVRINDDRYRLDDFDDIEIEPLEQGSIAVVSMKDMLRQGFNYIQIMDNENSHILHSLYVFIDHDYAFMAESDYDQVNVAIQSIFTQKQYVQLDLKKDAFNEISFDSPYFSDPLYLVLDIDVALYRIDKKEWHTFTHNISKKEFNEYSRLWIEGLSFDTVLVLDDQGRQLKKLYKDTLKDHHYIQMASLVTNSFDAQFVSLIFIKNNIAVNSIKLYYKVTLKENSLQITYDDENEQVKIAFDYGGDDEVHIRLEDKNPIFSYDTTEHPVEVTVDRIETFKNLTFIITAGENDLFSLGSQEYEVYRQNVSFFSFKGIVGKTFQINGMWLEKYNKKTKSWDEYRSHLDETYLIVDQRINEDHFIGRAAYLKDKPVSLNVTILITSEIKEGGFWCALYVDDDLLLFDEENKTILFDEHSQKSKTALPIMEYKCKY